MLSIAICEFVEQDRKQIADLCKKYFKNKFIEYEIKEYASGESFLVEDFPDVLFLNTKIKGIDGILIKEVLYKMRANTKLVFISEDKSRVYDAFGKNVYGFMEKPVYNKNFIEKMDIVIRDISEEKNGFYCKRNKEIVWICFREIVCIQAYGRYTKIYLYSDKGYLLCDRCFGEWYLEMENKEFLCSHRSYLVNIFYIKQIQAEIELINGMKVPLASDRRKEFFDSYKAYMRSKENGISSR